MTKYREILRLRKDSVRSGRKSISDGLQGVRRMKGIKNGIRGRQNSEKLLKY